MKLTPLHERLLADILDLGLPADRGRAGARPTYDRGPRIRHAAASQQ
ncbi:hypothetical protein [Streptomyces sp. I6]|nr:hypothetical protein [Streptomyces sp. I6]